MDNGCSRCKRRYLVDELDEQGYPLHVRYCDDCTKFCTKCGEWKTVDRFQPNLESPGYQDWIRTKSRETDSPLGLLSRADVLEECGSCKPFRDTPVPTAKANPTPEVPAAIQPEPPKDDFLARLDAAILRLQKK